ncbi:MAG: 2,3,4,5-tetrahydropyridine-2,6-dicarboxylate N-succinyltransferase [Blastocatellia bacterium]|nr:2,3,4,5-tetrahydropyridine-2,6-dicarboxylate N-succinyltransferase [Chloracidobacterium sp.]MBL8184701.1 2,3,4,5-tetrahydropyridine-2,6-dicarboxylate N-succinyltransferase [Blastocatellia bacterium]HBE82769.1 2,3,4,5-tetrahydropyridine-2,6-dicarboxylate N-succinyltransferase [Blastocatellia bacterium]HRJ88225.1 2,3,4,5-tetrahydropyridine-2,6-dicarboxylate N-succinyltransferase [Pyrinomonadaceae bacterium]HRK49291.1 2,3,4,5-tetrahydropyridine-2,6-dicarboxylate N-succinyltransferase [Pyrinomon
MNLQSEIERLFEESEFSSDDREIYETFKTALRRGEIRSAEKGADGVWRANSWVKQGILLGFRMGKMVEMSKPTETLQFFDKDTFPLRPMTLEDGVRIVMGGSAIRDGSYVAPSVVVVPPAYINVGAYVDEGTMVDSHALVGSCAQIGKRVHLSAAAQIGGVLEPVGALPVIIEDDVLVGGNTGVYEGTIVREQAVLASGVILTRSTPVFDLPNERVIKSTDNLPLEIPAGAVVVQGARAVSAGFGKDNGLSIYCPIIVKYRDEKTQTSTRLEDYLR